MLTIKFSKNWNNKLNNDIFTTIRSSWGQMGDKQEYYQNNIDNVFDVILNKKIHSQVKLVSVSEYNFEDLPKTIIMIDTGMKWADAIHMFNREMNITYASKVLLLCFEKIKEDSK